MTYQIPFSCLGVIIGLIKMASDYEPVQKKSAFWVGTNQTKVSLLNCTYFLILLLANNAEADQTAPGLSLICILIFSIWQDHDFSGCGSNSTVFFWRFMNEEMLSVCRHGVNSIPQVITLIDISPPLETDRSAEWFYCI